MSLIPSFASSKRRRNDEDSRGFDLRQPATPAEKRRWEDRNPLHDRFADLGLGQQDEFDQQIHREEFGSRQAALRAVDEGKRIMKERWDKRMAATVAADDAEYVWVDKDSVTTKEEPRGGTSNDIWSFHQEQLERRVREAHEARLIRSRVELAQDLMRDKHTSPGDMRLERIRQYLNQMGYTRSQFQRF